MTYFDEKKQIGQYELEGYEQLAIVAGGAVSTMAILLLYYVYYIRKAQFLRRHPGEILMTRSHCELLWVLVFVIVPFIPSNEILTKRADEYRANQLTVLFAMIVQWAVLASELWYLVLAIDLFTSITNPFSSYKASQKWYKISAYGFPTMMSLLLIPIRKDNIGITSFFIPWLVQPCSLKLYVDDAGREDSNICEDAPIDFRKWVFLYIWVIVIELFTLFVLLYANHRLQQGIPHTLAQRNETLQKGKTYIFSMCSFWCAPALLATLDYYLNYGSSLQSQRRHQDFNVSISVLLSLRGTWSVLTILYMYRRDYKRSPTELIVRKAAEEQSFQPHLNIALRTEVLFYATLCVRSAVMNHEVSGVEPLHQDNDSDVERGSMPRETEMTDTLRHQRHSTHLPTGVFEDNGRTYVYEIKSLGRQGLTSHPIARQILAEQETRTMMDRMSVRETIRGEAHGLDELAAEYEAVEAEAVERQLEEEAQAAAGIHTSASAVVHNELVAGAKGMGEEKIDMSKWPRSSAFSDSSMDISPPTRQARFSINHRPRKPSGNTVFMAGSRGDTGAANIRSQSCTSKFMDRIFPDANVLRFRDYSPDLFTQIRRDICKLDPMDYMDSWTTTTRESFSEGASGAFIFFSKDGKYIVKTTTSGEMDVLLSILPDYVQYLRDNPYSRLLKILGAHRMECYGQKLEFLVMNNIFPTDLDMDERYDLKGSWVNRSSSRGSGERPRGKVLKDMDLNYVFMTRADVGYRLAAQINKDVSFLCSKNLMDYSLLVGVQNATFPVEVENDLPSEMDPFIGDERGGMNAAVVAGPAVFYVGLIDILQVWNVQKQIERLAKIVFKCVDRRGLSAIPATVYKERFMQRAVLENFNGAKSRTPPPRPLAVERVPRRSEAGSVLMQRGNRRATFRGSSSASISTPISSSMSASGWNSLGGSSKLDLSLAGSTDIKESNAEEDNEGSKSQSE